MERVLCFKDRQTLNLSDSNGNPAQWTVILGDNGVGKTTLLRCLAGMETTFSPFSTEENKVFLPLLPDAYLSDSLSMWEDLNVLEREKAIFHVSLVHDQKLSTSIEPI